MKTVLNWLLFQFLPPLTANRAQTHIIWVWYFRQTFKQPTEKFNFHIKIDYSFLSCAAQHLFTSFLHNHIFTAIIVTFNSAFPSDCIHSAAIRYSLNQFWCTVQINLYLVVGCFAFAVLNCNSIYSASVFRVFYLKYAIVWYTLVLSVCGPTLFGGK